MEYEKCKDLVEFVDNLPEDYFIVGDAAYILSNQLLVPFTRATNRSHPHKMHTTFIFCNFATGLKWHLVD
jgi:hypothetical protein